jgi:hypothetical protein
MRKFKKFIFTVKHDKGKDRLVVIAQSKSAAYSKLTLATLCPDRAVIKCEEKEL